MRMLGMAVVCLFMVACKGGDPGTGLFGSGGFGGAGGNGGMGGAGGTGGEPDAGLPCMFRNILTEPCSEGEPGCVERCCDTLTPANPPASAYCWKFPAVDNCFDTSVYDDPSTGGTVQLTGYQFCKGALAVKTCGPCFDPFLMCWMQGCSDTH